MEAIKFTDSATGLWVAGRKVKPNEVMLVSEVGEGVAQSLVDNGRAKRTRPEPAEKK